MAPEAAYPAADTTELLVVNTLPWPRTVTVEEPEQRGGAAPDGVLESFFPRDVPWGGFRPVTPMRRVTAELPGAGYAFVSLDATPAGDDLRAAANTIENAHYRVRIDPATGAIAEWFDKDLDHDFAGAYQGWGIGQYVYERVESPEGRGALTVGDFSLEDFGYWRTDTPWQRMTAETVRVGEPVVEHGQAAITVEITGPGVRGGRCTYALESGQKRLAVDWLLDKSPELGIEAVFVAFPFALGDPAFRADINGVACTPDVDQLEGTVRDWYPVQRWIDVSDGVRGVTLAPLDAPLVQVGGITTGRTPRRTPPEGPTLMSWALHNHWMVNFKASQEGEIPLRYRLTTHAGGGDDAAAARFGAEAATPPVVLRDYSRRGDPSEQFFELPADAAVLVTAKPAENGDGVILRVQNLLPESQQVPLRFPARRPSSACLTSPVEVDGERLALTDDGVSVPLTPRAVQSLRVRF